MKKLFVLFAFTLVLFATTVFGQGELIYGSTPGAFFVKACVTNNEAMIIMTTSTESLEKFGEDKVMQFLKELEFPNNDKWTFNNTTKISDNKIVHEYTRSVAGVYAKVVKITLVKENGQWKFVFPDKLNTFLK